MVHVNTPEAWRTFEKGRTDGMLHLTGDAFRSSAAISRRGFLTIGGLAPLGLGLSQVMAAREANAAATAPQTSAILFFMAGGPSHIGMYDRKPDQVEEVRGPFSCAAEKSNASFPSQW